MFSKQDEIQIKERGSDIEKVKIQIESFKKGFPFLKIEKEYYGLEHMGVPCQDTIRRKITSTTTFMTQMK